MLKDLVLRIKKIILVYERYCAVQKLPRYDESEMHYMHWSTCAEKLRRNNARERFSNSASLQGEALLTVHK